MTQNASKFTLYGGTDDHALTSQTPLVESANPGFQTDTTVKSGDQNVQWYRPVQKHDEKHVRSCGSATAHNPN